MKKREPSSLKILYPTAFHFKEERVLAAHPPSCHPWRVFGCPESGKKMKENGEKVKKAGELKAFAPKNYCLSDSPVQSLIKAYILLRTREIYKTNQNQKLLQGIK